MSILSVLDIKNKIKEILGWTPKYENYRLGLNNIFKVNSNG